MDRREPATILIADPSPPVRGLLRDTFLDAGYEVVLAEAGEQALRLAEQKHPDLLLVEVDLPGMDGYALCAALKADPHYREIPVVFLSARREVADRLEGLRAGAEDYLLKPFSTEELLLRINRIIARRRSAGPAMESGRTFLSGHTSHLPLPDLVQMLSMNAKTGCLRVLARELGRVYFREGQIVAAFAGRTRGRKALFRIVAWENAHFHFDPDETIDAPAELGPNTQRLLMDAFVAHDELGRLRHELPDRAAEVVATAKGRALLAGDGATADGLERRVLELAEVPVKVGELLDGLDATDLEIARAVVALRRGGALQLAGVAERAAG
ncbi:MAG: response regulator [Acidobacteria bacterium]|nr:MAG: response regulator [Acidobacteriota bacterium]